MPHALVVRATEREEEGHPVTGEWDRPLCTRAAADAVAKELDMDLIYSQCEHDYQLESVGGVYLTGGLRLPPLQPPRRHVTRTIPSARRVSPALPEK